MGKEPIQHIRVRARLASFGDDVCVEEKFHGARTGLRSRAAAGTRPKRRKA
jgi:hypothetical protein